MTVREMLIALDGLPDDMEVRVETTFRHDVAMPIQSLVISERGLVLRDHQLTYCSNQTFTSFDGTEYEVGFVGVR